jgi:pimeloyl-ACP methyl ester carboxylesterase
MAETEHKIRTRDGLAVYVRDIAPVAPLTGLPVLCLHGLTRNSKDFSLVAERIAALGRRAIAMDVRGRGRSDWDPQPERYQPPTYVQDAFEVLDALKVERAVWLGTSMGGLITTVAALSAPQRVAGAILNDIGPVVDPAGLARIASYAGNSLNVRSWAEAAAAVKATQDVAFPNRDDAFWLDFAQRTFRQRADTVLEPDYDPAIAKALGQGPAPDLWAMFDVFKTIPTLVIRGALSDILSRETLAQMHQRNPNLESAEAPWCGHAPTLEEPCAFLPIVDFLAKAP